MTLISDAGTGTFLNNLGHVCFLESSFREITFQTFMCLFVIRKVGQRKIWFDFQESVFPFGCVCFPESSFRETTFQTFLCLFAIRKVGQRKPLSRQRKHFPVNGKHFSVKEKFSLVSSKGHVCFPEFTFRETTFQTFLCLFAIRKVGQRKTFSGQRKTLSSQRKHFSVNGKHFLVKKNLVWFSRKCFPF
jgi:hypothetical protein